MDCPEDSDGAAERSIATNSVAFARLLVGDIRSDVGPGLALRGSVGLQVASFPFPLEETLVPGFEEVGISVRSLLNAAVGGSVMSTEKLARSISLGNRRSIGPFMTSVGTVPASRALVDLALRHGRVDVSRTPAGLAAVPPSLDPKLRRLIAAEIARLSLDTFASRVGLPAGVRRSLSAVIANEGWLDDTFVRQAVAMRRAELRLWAAHHAYPELWPFANDLFRTARHLAAISRPYAKARDGLAARTLAAISSRRRSVSEVVVGFLGEMSTYLGADRRDSLPAVARTALFEGGRRVLTPSTLGTCEARVECVAPGGMLSVRYRSGFWAAYGQIALLGVTSVREPQRMSEVAPSRDESVHVRGAALG